MRESSAGGSDGAASDINLWGSEKNNGLLLTFFLENCKQDRLVLLVTDSWSRTRLHLCPISIGSCSRASNDVGLCPALRHDANQSVGFLPSGFIYHSIIRSSKELIKTQSQRALNLATTRPIVVSRSWLAAYRYDCCRDPCRRGPLSHGCEARNVV